MVRQAYGRGRAAGMVAAALMAFAAAAGAGVRGAEPKADGPAKLICASLWGDGGTEQFVGAGVQPDGTIVLAGNRQMSSLRAGGGSGFLLTLKLSGAAVTARKPLRLSGQVLGMKLAPDGSVCLAVRDAGVFMVRADSSRVLRQCPVRDVIDFGVDGTGELVVLHGQNMTRFDRTWRKRLWTASWHTHGGNRPGGVAVCTRTGVATVVGYGMTHTGREPWKDPYAYGFSRAGKEIWKLWDPKPGRQVSSQHGGNGLMADTTGDFAAAGPDGKLYLSLYADGGNSVCTRDPADPDKPIDPQVYNGVYQKGPGHGFKGASKTSVAFRVDAATGRLEKGTWMCAWLTPARANGLGMDALAADEAGRVYLAGGSASGCPEKAPWYPYESGYKGGGFLAIFDAGFAMLQCGMFQGTGLQAVAVGGGLVVVAGHAKPAGEDAVPVHNPVQPKPGGGEADGYFAIFQTARP